MGKTKKKATKQKKTIKLKELKSPRQLVAVKKISEILGNSKGKKNITMGKILKEAGYSISTSETPGRVIETKSFQDLLEKHLPDDMITEVHGGIMKATRIDHMVFPLMTTDEEITEIVESVAGCKVKKFKHGENGTHVWFWSPDNQSRLRAVSEAYKVKNKYPTQKIEETIIHKFEEMDDSQLDEAINELD